MKFPTYEKLNGLVRLQGIGLLKGTPAGDVKPGMWMVMNYGYKYRVVSVAPCGAKSVYIEFETPNHNYQSVVRKYIKTTLVVARES